MKVTALAKLDEATRRWHLGIAASWRGLLEVPTRANYLGSLVRTYGFVAPLEGACRYTPGLERLLDTRALTRAGLLAQDLLMLGLMPADVTQLPQCHRITTFKDIPEALGWLYVLYRAALATRTLREQIVLADPRLEEACAYIAAVGEHGGDHWLAFERTVEVIGESRQDDIIAAATSALAALERWNENTDFESWRKTG